MTPASGLVPPSKPTSIDAVFGARRRKKKRIRASAGAVASSSWRCSPVSSCSSSRPASGCGVATLGSTCDLERAAAGGDRRELVRLRRRRLAARRDPGRAEPPAGPARADQPVDAARRRSRSRTAASTSTAASTPRASRAPSGRTCSAGEVVQGGSTITQQLVRNLYISRERTVERKLKEACLAIKLDRNAVEGRILADVHEPRLLRQPRVRRRGGRADVLLASPRSKLTLTAGGAARRPAAGAVGLRPVPRARRSRSPAATRCCGAMLETGDDHAARSTDWAVATTELRPEARASSTRAIREPYFFSYVRDELIARVRRRRPCARAGCSVYTTIDPRFQRVAQAGDPRDALPSRTIRPPRSSRSTRRTARSAR